MKVQSVETKRRPSQLVTMAVASILVMFFGVPIGLILYGGAGSALGGFLLLGLLIILQVPAFSLFHWMKLLPTTGNGDEHTQST
jgi:ABC-type dipeptide/oligopeptide/nickel transport system permease component